MIPEVGQKFGPYEILGTLGGGAMGLVFRAWDRRLQREVAIKLLQENYQMPGMRERFLQEARAASALNHPTHLHHLRYRGAGRQPVPGNGTARRRDAEGADFARGDAGGGYSLLLRWRLPMPGSRARQGNRPSRRQAGEYLSGEKGERQKPGEDAGLRPGQD